MKLQRLLSVLILLALVGCQNTSIKNNGSGTIKPTEKQWNLTILLDLSDRIALPPTDGSSISQMMRDTAVINAITMHFIKEHMGQKRIISMKDKLQVLFLPAPSDPKINQWAAELQADFEECNKKDSLYNNLQDNFRISIRNIYKASIQTNKFEGADIWGFFKNDIRFFIKDPAVYRNILVILTDGYLYNKHTKAKQGNRYSYLTSPLLKTTFGNNLNWKDQAEKLDFGLLVPQQNLSDLEVLLLELNPSSYRQDEMLKHFLEKWLNEMGVSRHEIYTTDPNTINTKRRIEHFLKNDE
ncbi:MAG: hypothetical protein NC250_03770 [Alistipes senegalensis]|nr:hypothetical protein [Bacteroides cellulosilyticus]MCM1351833.1 hypothetical protein [Alistipes senegalensis]